MALNTEQVGKLTEWMEQKGVGKQCPACGRPDGLVPGDIVAAPVVAPGGMRIGDNMPAMVQVVCSNCAHVMLFSAEPLSLYQPRKY